MIGNSLSEYLFIRTSITALRLVAPASIGYLLFSLYHGKFLGSIWIGISASSEAAFYLFIYLPRCKRLQAPPSYPPLPLSESQRRAIFKKCLSTTQSGGPLYPSSWFIPPNSSPKRDDTIDWLLWAFFSTTRNAAGDLLNEWRNELDHYISEIEKLLGRKLEEGSNGSAKAMRLTFDPVFSLHRPLIWYTIVALVDTVTSIALLGLGFKHYSPNRWFQEFPPRPLLCLFSKRAPENVRIPYWYRPHRSETKRPLVFLHGIGIGLYPYLPLIRTFIARSTGDSDVGVLLPELLPISMHMTREPVLPRPSLLASLDAILDHLGQREEDASCSKSPSDRQSPSTNAWSDVVLASHSYGTFVASWILHACISPTLPLSLHKKIAHIVLVDPIPILLSNPAVAHNFVYREPWNVRLRKGVSPSEFCTASDGPSMPSDQGRASAAAWQLWYFASRDADVARTLGRAFFWTEGGVWKEELESFVKLPSPANDTRIARNQKFSDLDEAPTGLTSPSCGTGHSQELDTPSTTMDENDRDTGRNGRNIAVVLAEHDQIIPSEEIRRYLTDDSERALYWVGKLQDGKSQRMEDCGSHKSVLEVLCYPDLDHATMFETQERRQRVIDVLRRYVRA